MISIGDGAADSRDPHALAIYLLRATPTDLNPAEPIQVELKILNSGVPIELPVSPNCPNYNPTMSLWLSTILAWRWWCERKVNRKDYK